jgi:hypothetical protein
MAAPGGKVVSADDAGSLFNLAPAADMVGWRKGVDFTLIVV